MTTFHRLLLTLLFLTLFRVAAYPQQSSTVLDHANTALDIATATGIFENIIRNNLFVESLLAATQQVTVPVGIRVLGNEREHGMTVILAVDQVAFLTHHVEFNLFAKAVVPHRDENGNPTTLFFGAQGIRIAHNGSMMDNARLVLLSDVTIPLSRYMSLVLLGHYDRQTGQTRSATYMSIVCAGFDRLSLDAKVRFPETLLERVDTDGRVDPNNRAVYGRFQTVIQDWNDIVAGITLPDFQIANLDGFIFNLQDVIFDFSDTRNHSNFVVPSGYEQFLIPGAENLWRGVFARQLEITLPRAFNEVNGQPTRFMAENMLIDENGITGLFSAHNILTFERGDASGWNFSVDGFSLKLMANRFIGAGFFGEIGLPFYGGNSRLAYNARMQGNNEFIMEVEPAEELDFSIFNATATIYRNSFVKLHVVDGRFRPEAYLHGHMRVAAELNIPRLDFRSLHLKTEAPYLSVAHLGYSGRVTLGSARSFTASLSNIEMTAIDGNARLSSDVDVTLIENVFAGGTRVTLAASFQERGGRRQWRYDGMSLTAIRVESTIANVITLNGEVEWHQNDPTFGDGFIGDLDVTIRPVGNLRVNMRGGFGAMEDFRYWFLDGYVGLPRGLPIMPSALYINGFAGAVSQRMRADGVVPQSQRTLSATRYVPDPNRGFGLRASVLLGIGSGGIGNGEASFDIAFNNRGGLCFIGFHGFARFAAQPPTAIGSLVDRYQNVLNNLASLDYNAQSVMRRNRPNEFAQITVPRPQGEVGILGSIAIQYNFANSTFHAKTELFINTPGNFFSGRGPGGRAGWGEFFIAPNEWFLHLGTPSDRLGVRLGVGGLGVEVGAYLMAGSRIPAMPPPPRQVADILGRDLDRLTIGRNISALNTGRSFAFGADFGMDTGDLRFLILYARFQAGLGFDIMFQNFGNAICIETGRQIGMNGWYAMGQAYAFFQGELGVDVNLWFVRRRIPLIRGGAATLMQAGLPNPAFFNGHLGVQFSVLGGLVRGNMRFRISLGDECTPLIIGGDAPLPMDMISDIAPIDGSRDISVFATPQATFSETIGKQFQSDGRTYRIQFRSFTLRADNGQVITGTHQWNRDRTAVSFKSHDILPSHTRITARVEVSFDRLSGGRWETIISEGQPAIESKEVVFTTGDAPNYIPWSNILYAYPIIEQRYFLPNESRRGFVQLMRGQPELLERGFNYRLVFTGDDGHSVSTDFTYNQQNRRFDFNIPELRNRRRYTLQIVFTPDDAQGGVAGAGGQAQQLITGEGDGSLIVESRAAYAGVNLDIETSILEYSFGTSRFATFRQKIESMDVTGGGVAQNVGSTFRFLTYVRAEEAFDAAEITGVMHSGNRPLIRAHAELREPFFTQTVYPLVYSGYPFGNIRLTHRNDQVMGVPPTRSVFIYRPFLNLIADGRRAPNRFRFPFSFEAAIVVEQDFRNLQSLVINSQTVAPAIRHRFLTNSQLPFIHYGRYRVILQYVLPDGTVTSSTPFSFYNFLRFNTPSGQARE